MRVPERLLGLPRMSVRIGHGEHVQRLGHRIDDLEAAARCLKQNVAEQKLWKSEREGNYFGRS